MKPEYIKQTCFWFNFLKVETGTWADKTFPKSSNYSIINHMNEEFDELRTAVLLEDKEQIAKEGADVLLLLLHLCFKNDIDIGVAALEKLAVNKERVWDTEPNSAGYYKHKENP